MTMLALIPPISMLRMTEQTDCQLMLPHLLGSRAYKNVYERYCRDPNQYVILDNGAAENVQVSFKRLCDIAWTYGVSEMVLPDVLGDGAGTMSYTEDSFSYIKDQKIESKFSYAVVAQGQTYEEARGTAIHGIALGATTISIPRLLIKATGDPRVRIRLARELDSSPVDIHFLGASPYATDEFRIVADVMDDKVRSMDTSAPFVYAWHNTEYPYKAVRDRPPGYFERPYGEFNPKYVKLNVGRMLDAFGYYEP